MKKMVRTACVLLLAISLLTVPAFAADYGDTFPEGFTFWAESTGDKIIVGGGSTSSSNNTSKPAGSSQSDSKQTDPNTLYDSAGKPVVIDLAAYADELL